MFVHCICERRGKKIVVVMDKTDLYSFRNNFFLFLSLSFFFIWQELCKRKEGIQELWTKAFTIITSTIF